MHPALSIVAFTVLSGAGYGLLALLGLLRAVGAVDGAAAGRGAGVHLALVLGAALVLCAGGLLSSTLHLANPKNAWRAFSMWRTSWLSREGVLALASFPVAGAWVACEFLGAGGVAPRGLALVAAVLALAIVYCTAMIYASLKTIPAWHSGLVPAAYLALSLYTGALLLALAGAVGAVPFGRVAALGLVALTVVVAVGVKIAWYARLGRTRRSEGGGPLSWTAKPVRLLDAGHAAGTFTTSELGFRAGAARLARLRALVPLLGVVVPAGLVTFAVLAGSWGEAASASTVATVAAAALAALAGVTIERWLFFAEARHVVNRYQVTGR